MAEDASCSTDNRKAVSTIKPEQVHSTVRQPQQYQANINEEKRAPPDIMALSHPRLETGDTAIHVPVSSYNGPLDDVSSGGAGNPLDVVTKGASDNDGAKGLPGVTTEAPSELKELKYLPGLPAEGADLHEEKGSNCGPEEDALGRAEGENKNELVSGSDLQFLSEDSREGSGCGERSASILAAEGRDGLASPRDPCHNAGEPVGTSLAGCGCSAPGRRSVGEPSWQQPQQETRLPSKAASEHRTLSPRACSVWDMDSLSDEEDGGVLGGREGVAAEEVIEDDTEGVREISVEARGVASALPQRLEMVGKAFEMPPSKRVRVEERPFIGVDEDKIVAKGNGNSGRGSASTSREDVEVALDMAEANEKARQLMPPPPPNVGRAKMRHRRSRVTLMHSPRYQRLCGLIERNSRRDDLLYALLGASGLQGRLSVVSPALATGGHLRSFHDRAYVEALRSPPSDPKTLEEFGLTDDCEAFEELYDYCCAVAGASIHAADRLCRGEADVAINWGGGRHHAKKGEAAGFCYVNDGVLAVLHLIKTFSRVLTIDIDVHHGDGIQEAFYMSDKVMTVSFHHLAKGFFPGAGHCFETGAGSGKGFNLNVPLKEGCRDTCFLRMFMGVISTMVDGFQPEAVVILCGADTLSSDPLGPFNLTSVGIRDCVGKVVGLDLPLLMLGGGGYCPTDTARLWTTLTAAAVGPEAIAALPAMIPDHAYFPLYGPDFRMATRHKLIPDNNDEAYLTRLCDFVVQAGRRARTIRQSREPHVFQEYTDTGGSW